MAETEKKTRKRSNGPRKNYQKQLERVTEYSALIVRIKRGVHDEIPLDQPEARARANGQIDAYLDVQNYMEGK